MSFEFRYAFRNLLSKRGGLARLTGVSAVAGIAFGVAGLIVVQAIYLGFRTGIESSLLSQTAHVTIAPERNDVIPPEIVQGKFARIPNVKSVEQVIFRSSVVTNDGEASYGLLRVDITNSGSQPDGVLIGKILAKRIGAKTGSNINLIIPSADSNAIVFDAKVTGFIETGLYEYDSSLVRLNGADYSKLNPDSAADPRSFLVTLQNPFEVEQTVNDIKRQAGSGFSVEDWRSANRPLFTALSLERRIAAAIIVLMILISSLGIAATLVLLVNERRIDLAVLKTCGARSRSLAIIFLTEGIVIGVIGIVLGAFLGSMLCAVFNYFEIISLPGEVYSISKLILIQNPITTVLIVVGAFLLVIPSILLPVRRAAKIRPMEIIREM